MSTCESGWTKVTSETLLFSRIESRLWLVFLFLETSLTELKTLPLIIESESVVIVAVSALLLPSDEIESPSSLFSLSPGEGAVHSL